MPVDASAGLSRRPRLTRRRALLLALLAALIASGGVVYFWLFDGLPSIDDFERGLALPSTRIYDRKGRLLYEILPPEQGRNTVIPLDEIPAHCVNAVIAVEDANFYSHIGVDPAGILRALWINLQGGEVLAGGSTITQQLVRTVLLDPQQRAERTLQRKLKEAILAIQLQTRYSKDEILGLYLNQVYFGNLAYGIEGAAQAYFGKGARDLSLAECALLAGIIQNAALHDPLSNPDSARARQEVALDLMLARGSIDALQADAARADDLQFAATRFPIEAPHFVMAVWKQLERLYPDRLYREGLDVTTTLDLDWQRAAERIANRHLDYLNHSTGRVSANANNAALVALDPVTGEVLTMLGSPDYFDEAIDGAVNATLALRQPGSALKPFTYAAAMDPARPSPLTAASMLLDVRTGFVTRKLESYVPGNYGLTEHGVVLAREALASSYNIPAVLVLEQVGVQTMVELAARAGLTTLAGNPNLDLAVTLGGGEVRLLDLAQAYSIFANGGYHVDPVMIRQVTQRGGDVLYTWRPPALERRLIDARVAFLVTDILSDPEARRREFGVPSPLDIGRPAAAKTGTTTDYRDNWVAGYTPGLVTAVWVGNADNTPMIDVSGISGAGPIWNEFMRTVHQGQPEQGFPRPDGLERVEVCALSGLLPTEYCTNRRSEWFISGTAPTEPDTLYQPVEIDTATGLPADERTPPSRRRTEVYVVLPPEARDWGRTSGLRVLPDTFVTAQASAANASGDTPRITAPPAFSTYQLAPNRPANTQRLHFQISAPPGTQAVTWRLNGETLATVRAAPFALWWPLALGDFQLSAVVQAADGRETVSAPVAFAVVEYQDPIERAADRSQ
jgi:penicillin-binding protein 1C